MGQGKGGKMSSKFGIRYSKKTNEERMADNGD